MASNVRAGGAFIQLFVKNEVTAALTKIRRELGAFAASTAKIGAGLAGAGGLGSVAITKAVEQFGDLDRRIREAAAAAGVGESGLNGLRAAAKNLSTTTGLAATDIAGIQTEIARAFGDNLDISGINKITEITAKLAAATGEQSSTVAGILASTLSQFKLGAEQAGNVADLLVSAANSSQASVGSLGETLQYVGPIAASFGVGVKEVLSYASALSNLGIKGSEAGTALRRLLLISTGDNESLQRIFNVPVDASRPLIENLTKIVNATKGLDLGTRTAKFREAFDILGITAATGLGASANEIQKFLGTFDKAGGSLNKQFALITGGVNGSIARLRQSFAALVDSIGQALAPSFSKLADVAGPILIKLSEWIKRNQQLVITFGALSAAAVTVGAGVAALGGVGVIVAGLGSVGTAIGSLVGSISALLAPIGATGLAITAAVGGSVAALLTFSEEGRRFSASIGQFFLGAAGQVAKSLSDISRSVSASVGPIFGLLLDGKFQEAWKLLWQTSVTVTTTALASIKAATVSAFQSVLSSIGLTSGEIATLWNLMTGTIQANLQGIATVGQAIFGGLKAFVIDFIGVAKFALQPLLIQLRVMLRTVSAVAKLLGVSASIPSSDKAVQDEQKKLDALLKQNEQREREAKLRREQGEAQRQQRQQAQQPRLPGGQQQQQPGRQQPGLPGGPEQPGQSQPPTIARDVSSQIVEAVRGLPANATKRAAEATLAGDRELAARAAQAAVQLDALSKRAEAALQQGDLQGVTAIAQQAQGISAQINPEELSTRFRGVSKVIAEDLLSRVQSASDEASQNAADALLASRQTGDGDSATQAAEAARRAAIDLQRAREAFRKGDIQGLSENANKALGNRDRSESLADRAATPLAERQRLDAQSKLTGQLVAAARERFGGSDIGKQIAGLEAERQKAIQANDLKRSSELGTQIRDIASDGAARQQEQQQALQDSLQQAQATGGFGLDAAFGAFQGSVQKPIKIVGMDKLQQLIKLLIDKEPVIIERGRFR